jgi:hypothetical protein
MVRPATTVAIAEEAGRAGDETRALAEGEGGLAEMPKPLRMPVSFKQQDMRSRVGSPVIDNMTRTPGRGCAAPAGAGQGNDAGSITNGARGQPAPGGTRDYGAGKRGAPISRRIRQ